MCTHIIDPKTMPEDVYLTRREQYSFVECSRFIERFLQRLKQWKMQLLILPDIISDPREQNKFVKAFCLLRTQIWSKDSGSLKHCIRWPLLRFSKVQDILPHLCWRDVFKCFGHLASIVLTKKLANSAYFVSTTFNQIPFNIWRKNNCFIKPSKLSQLGSRNCFLMKKKHSKREQDIK